MDDTANKMPKSKGNSAETDDRSYNCPYLDTINRYMLDFDFEKLCSISLSHLNVYACLVCGKYFQGRGKNSHAYLHSIETNHHVWISLTTLKFYCLPENYEIIDASLNDIKKVIDPKYDIKTINELDFTTKMSRAIDGSTYYPGIIGMNNIRETDYINVVLHTLAFVKPIRNYFIREKNYIQLNKSNNGLMVCFGELVRKVWNNSAFKTHVSPHEMIQSIVKVSNKKFVMEKQSGPILFLSWFIHCLNSILNVKQYKKKSIIDKTFRGKMIVFSKKIPVVDDPTEKKILSQKPEYQPTQIDQPFYFLTLDVPPPPLFTDSIEFSIIPQIAITDLLAKYDGTREKEFKTYKEFYIKRYLIKKLPKYLILHIKRFSQNYFFKEKSRTVVNFNLKGLDMREYIHPNYLEKNKNTVYNLVSNIFVQSEAGNATKPQYCLQILHKPTSKWFQIRDLQVTEIMPPMISLTESYIQIWEQHRIVTN